MVWEEAGGGETSAMVARGGAQCLNEITSLYVTYLFRYNTSEFDYCSFGTLNLERSRTLRSSRVRVKTGQTQMCTGNE